MEPTVQYLLVAIALAVAVVFGYASARWVKALKASEPTRILQAVDLGLTEYEKLTKDTTALVEAQAVAAANASRFAALKARVASLP